jgi:MscS family membrane protein
MIKLILGIVTGLFIGVAMAHEVIVLPADIEPTNFLESIKGILDKEITHAFTIRHLGIAFGVIFLTLAFRRLIVRSLLGWLKRMTHKTRFHWDEMVIDAFEQPIMQLVLIVGLYIAIAILPLEHSLERFAFQLCKGLSVLMFSWGLLRFSDVFTASFQESATLRNSALTGFMPLIRKSLRIFIVLISVILVVDNLGYSVAGLITTLGLGGAAFAFAAKDTIANLYGSVALALDRPFKVGDWIAVGSSVDGTVESIGMRSTRVRTFPKTLLTIPNNYLANEIINNWSRMPKRRVKQFIGITYDASGDDMDAIVEDIREILRTDEGVEQSYMMVYFTDFGPSSLDIMVYYFSKTIVWAEYLEVRQRINTKIMRAVKARGLSIAFPTQTVYFEGEVARRMAESRTDLPFGRDSGPATP